MSNEALNWAFAQDIRRSADKVLLICLANYADELGVCFPSQTKLTADSSLDRKTVITAMDRLREAGLIVDTGYRKGSTRQVVVYRLTGVGPCTVHYTYRTTDPETGEFYVGKRSFSGDPQADGYRGSGKWVLAAKAAGKTLVREILAKFGTVQEALAHEQAMFLEVEGDPLCRNDGLPSQHRKRTMDGVERIHARKRAEQAANQSSPKTAPLDVPTTAGSVPILPPNGPDFTDEASRFSHKDAQKRDTEPLEPSENQELTLIVITRGANVVEFPIIKVAATSKHKARTSIDPNWQPSAVDIAYAWSKGIDPAGQVDRFVASHMQRGSVMASWPAAWRTWVLNSPRYDFPGGGGGGGGRIDPKEGRRAAYANPKFGTGF